MHEDTDSTITVEADLAHPNVWATRMRHSAGMSQTELGDAMSPPVPQRSISRWETTCPPTSRALDWALACGVPTNVAEEFRRACVTWHDKAHRRRQQNRQRRRQQLADARAMIRGET
jgi:hypothetical protein